MPLPQPSTWKHDSQRGCPLPPAGLEPVFCVLHGAWHEKVQKQVHAAFTASQQCLLHSNKGLMESKCRVVDDDPILIKTHQVQAAQSGYSGKAR